jgi:hypothetical protein
MDVLVGFCMGGAFAFGLMGVWQAHRLQRDLKAHIRALDAAREAREAVERELEGQE